MLSRLVKRSQELPDVWSVYFEKPEGFIFTAGDYTELELNYPPNGGRRWFSLASSPSEDHLRITFKLPKPHSKFKAELMKLDIGQGVQLAPPMGNFNLPLKPKGVLFVAIGIGVTPFRSITEELISRGRLKKWGIKMVHAAKKNEFLFEETFEYLKKDRFKISPTPRLTTSALAGLVPDFSKRIIYLAGPEAVTAVLYEELAEIVPKGQLRLSYFPEYKSIDV